MQGNSPTRSPYLCFIEFPRSLRGICGDQRGTERVSGEEETGERGGLLPFGNTDEMSFEKGLSGLVAFIPIVRNSGFKMFSQ